MKESRKRKKAFIRLSKTCPIVKFSDKSACVILIVGVQLDLYGIARFAPEQIHMFMDCIMIFKQ